MRFWRMIATLGPIGYLSAPGTLASLLTLPLIFWLQHALHTYGYIALLIAIFALGAHAVQVMLKEDRRHQDPSEIVIDEVVGCMLTFVAVPLCMQTLVIGFVFFRFFDILKIGAIRRIDEWANPWAVMMDDVAAGILSNLLLHLMVRCVIP